MIFASKNVCLYTESRDKGGKPPESSTPDRGSVFLMYENGQTIRKIPRWTDKQGPEASSGLQVAT